MHSIAMICSCSCCGRWNWDVRNSLCVQCYDGGIKNRVSTSTATLPQGSGMNTWSEAVRVNNEEGGMIPCPSSSLGGEGRVDKGTRGPLYSFDDLPEGFPIRMGPEVDLFKPFHINSSGILFQYSDGTPHTLLPIGRGYCLGKADKDRNQHGRNLRHQGMGHSKDKTMQMQIHESDYDYKYDKIAPSKTRELDKVIINEEEIKIEDENNDAKFAAFLEKELVYSARDEVRNHYMQVDPVHIEQRDEHTVLEAYYFNGILDFILESPLIIHYPKPNSYRQRIKSILGKKLQQLQIKVEPKEEKEANETSKAPAETVLLDRIGNNLPLSKWNKSRASASFARRLLILIRSHLPKKGLDKYFAEVLKCLWWHGRRLEYHPTGMLPEYIGDTL